MARPLKKQAKKLAERMKTKHPCHYRNYSFFYRDMLCFELGTSGGYGSNSVYDIDSVLEGYHYNRVELQRVRRGGQHVFGDSGDAAYLIRVSTSYERLDMFEPFMSMFRGAVFLVGARRDVRRERQERRHTPYQYFAPIFELASDYEIWSMFLKASEGQSFMIDSQSTAKLAAFMAVEEVETNFWDIDLANFNYYLRA